MVGWQMGFYGGPGSRLVNGMEFFGFWRVCRRRGSVAFLVAPEILKIHHIQEWVPPVISWFISPIKYSYICHKP